MTGADSASCGLLKRAPTVMLSPSLVILSEAKDLAVPEIQSEILRCAENDRLGEIQEPQIQDKKGGGGSLIRATSAGSFAGLKMVKFNQGKFRFSLAILAAGVSLLPGQLSARAKRPSASALSLQGQRL